MTAAPMPFAAPGASGPDESNAVYGVLQIGSARVALPLTVLREVTPCPPSFSGLPASAPGLLGAVAVRGKVLPVLDLRPLLGLPAPLGHDQVVVLLRHDGSELGLLVDGVCGLTRLPAGRLDRMRGGGAPLLFAGSFERSEDQTVVSLLDATALMSLPGVPVLQQPSAEQALRTPDGGGTARCTLMLARCGNMRLALDVTDVYATLPRVALQPSSMDGALCRGTIDHAGQRLPAVDPLALMALGALPPDEPCEALLLRYDTGLVALLVSQVIEIVRVPQNALVPLPPLALRRPELFRAALHVAGQGEHLVLGAAVLRTEPQLLSLATLNIKVKPQADAAGPLAGVTASAKAGGAARGHAVITYDIGTEVASRLTQVREVLPLPADCARPASDHPAVIGLFTHRGQAVTLVCLPTLLGAEPRGAAAAALETRVLLVGHGGAQFGFVVPRLCHIDTTVWEAPRSAAAAGTAGNGAGKPTHPLGLQAVIELGQGAHRRSLQLVDLQALAASLLSGDGAAEPPALAAPDVAALAGGVLAAD